DVDNDGDLDVVTGHGMSLHYNDGSGLFTNGNPGSFGAYDLPALFLDYNLDGFLDGIGDLGMFRGIPNGNHWLRVELAGVQSNRNGLGARVTAVTGDLSQMREIRGGSGRLQDEMVAHFGLGGRTQVDLLTVRWPSGQVDTVSVIPADQKIRVFEGRAGYHVVEPTAWVAAPDTVVAGVNQEVVVAVRPALFEPGAQVVLAVADLSGITGDPEVGLVDVGSGTHTVRAVVDVGRPNGLAELSVFIDQSTSLGPYWIRLTKQVAIIPPEDLQIYDEAMAPNWELKTTRVDDLDLAATEEVRHGETACVLRAEESRLGWRIELRPPDTLSLVGYDSLSFWFRPGDISVPVLPWLRVTPSPGKNISLLSSGLVDLGLKQWQRVVVPVAEPEFGQQLTAMSFSANCGGTLHLDDIRLIAAIPTTPTVSAVEEQRSTSMPTQSSLDQNYPNLLNNSTTLRFDLHRSGEIVLAVYNLAGQKVAVLAEGVRESGTHSLHWNGLDEQERELASGVYLCRLQAGAQMETRKLLLLR
ncbi:ASPIC/UnbV domain-containing protein, partial [Candidatus Latescibacterota bacterium]